MLGPFELLSQIGSGGAGDVWLGRHRTQGVEVAIKVLSRGASRQLHEAFLREARAVARLDHPAVIHLFDLGEVSAEAARRGPLVEGSPYLVMPLARGTLADEAWEPTWAEVAALLDRLLAGLAHAHARGVVHRDLKPANLLLLDEQPAERSVAIGDFGVALLRDERGGARVAGTPTYMAPEQLKGELGRIGAWTDLYALGCLAWKIVTGATPFLAEDRSKLIAQQLYAPLPTLEPRLPVPAGLDGWLARLLSKPVAARFQRAADARAALARLGAVGGGRFKPSILPAGPTTSVDTLDAGPTPDAAPERWAGGQAVGLDIAPGIPKLWKPALPPPIPLPLLGVGLRLYPLRDRPLVGRDAERSTLVDSLRAVSAERRLAIVLLEGSTGVGKSRLARWLVEWGAEYGYASSWSVRHGVGATADEGVDGLLRQLGLFTEGSAAARWERVRSALASQLLERPGVLWLDDVQHGPDALGLVRHLATADTVEPQPLLVVMTAQTEELALSPARGPLDQLRGLSCFQALDVGPLSGADRPLLTSMLRLRPGVDALRVEQASAGNPMVAVRLVEHALAGGDLVAGPAGFELRADAGLPEGLEALWNARVTEAMAGASAVEPAVMAAILGESVLTREWTDACAGAGIPSDRRPLDLLVHAGLLLEVEGGFRFAHGLARQATERLLPDRTALHRAAAVVVPDEAPWRRARHLLAAGLPAEALEPLLDAAWRLGQVGRMAESEWAMERFVQTADSLDVEQSDVRRGRLLSLRARMAFRMGRVDLAREWVDALSLAWERTPWPSVEPAMRYLRGDLAVMEGRAADAVDELNLGLAAAQREQDRHWIRACRTRRAHAWAHQGKAEQAAEELEQCVALADEEGAEVAAAVSCSWLSSIAYGRSRHAEALKWANEAVERANRIGEQSALGHALCVLGNASFQAGDSVAAVEAWRHSARRYDVLGSPQAAIPRINLGTQLWRDGDAEGAERELVAAEAEVARMGQQNVLLEVRLRRLCWSEDPAFWDQVLEEAEARFASLSKGSVSRTLDELWQASTDPERRRRVAGLAARVWEAAGDEERAAAARAALA